MKIDKRVVLSLLRTFSYIVGTVLLVTTVAQTQEPFLLDMLGGVEVWSEPQPAPGDGYEATRIVLRGTDPVAKLNTFENLRFDGDLVQTWLSGPFGTPTAKNVFVGPTYPEEWIPFDSHLLISSMPPPTMIGSGFFNGISETNDESIGEIPGLPSVVGNPSVSGIGPISMFRPTDAFFLVPDFESNEVAVAYLVRQAGADSHFTMTLGVLGSGIINSGEPGGASFGFNGNDPVEIHFVPEPSAEFLAMFA